MKNPEIDVALERIGFSKVVSSNQPERFNKSNISVYPNPVSDGILQITLNHPQSGEFEVSLLSAQGQLIHRWGKQIVNQGDNFWTLPLPLHLKGNYVLQLKSNQEMAAMPVYIH